jgi:hypothetical protein
MSYMSELDIKSRNAENDLGMMARQVASQVAMIQVVELTALAMEGPRLSEVAAKRMVDRVAEAGSRVVIEMVQVVVAELEAENQRLRATIDMLADQLVVDQAEFVPMTIPEDIPEAIPVCNDYITMLRDALRDAYTHLDKPFDSPFGNVEILARLRVVLSKVEGVKL